LSKGIFKVQDGSVFTPYIASIDRLKKKLSLIKKDHPEFKLQDVVQPHQIRYRLMNKDSELHNLEITFDVIDKAIFDFFSTIEITPKDFKEMIAVISDKIDVLNQDNKEKYSKVLLQLNRAKFQKKEFIKQNL